MQFPGTTTQVDPIGENPAASQMTPQQIRSKRRKKKREANRPIYTPVCIDPELGEIPLSFRLKQSLKQAANTAARHVFLCNMHNSSRALIGVTIQKGRKKNFIPIELLS